MDCNISESDPLVKVANITSTLIFQTLQYWEPDTRKQEMGGCPIHRRIKHIPTLPIWDYAPPSTQK